MAFFPCSNHHAPYRGASRAAYPALVDGASSDRRHLRMCEPCFRDYLGAVSEKLAEVNYDEPAEAEPSEAQACSFCGRVTEEKTVAAFVTAYPNKEPERAFWGRVCLECSPAARALLLLS